MEAAYSFAALLLSCPLRRHQALLVVFSVTHGQEIWAWPRAQSHLHSLDMSWLCTEVQTAGYQIRTQGLFFHSTPFVYHHLFLFSQSLFALCFFLSLLLSSYSSSFYPSLFGDGVTQVSRLRNECGGLFRQAGKCSISSFFYFIWVTHLCTSPLECEIAGVCQTGLAQGFWRRLQGSYVLLKTVHQPCCRSLWFAGLPSQISHQSPHKFQFYWIYQ